MEQKAGEFFKYHRIASGFKSQRQLADESGVSRTTISRLELDGQKPSVETLKELAKHLKTTSLVEMMVVCGYWDEEELLYDYETTTVDGEKVNARIFFEDEKSLQEYKIKPEKDLLKKIDLTDEEILKEFNITIDGRSLSKAEAKGIIAYIRSLRQM